MHPDEQKLIEVLRTDDAGFLPIVKSVLDAAGIPYLVQGEETLGLLPVGLLAIGTPKPLVCAIIRVAESRAEEARTLLETPAESLEPDGG